MALNNFIEYKFSVLAFNIYMLPFSVRKAYKAEDDALAARMKALAGQAAVYAGIEIPLEVYIIDEENPPALGMLNITTELPDNVMPVLLFPMEYEKFSDNEIIALILNYVYGLKQDKLYRKILSGASVFLIAVISLILILAAFFADNAALQFYLYVLLAVSAAGFIFLLCSVAYAFYFYPVKNEKEIVAKLGDAGSFASALKEHYAYFSRKIPGDFISTFFFRKKINRIKKL